MKQWIKYYSLSVLENRLDDKDLEEKVIKNIDAEFAKNQIIKINHNDVDIIITEKDNSNRMVVVFESIMLLVIIIIMSFIQKERNNKLLNRLTLNSNNYFSYLFSSVFAVFIITFIISIIALIPIMISHPIYLLYIAVYLLLSCNIAFLLNIIFKTNITLITISCILTLINAILGAFISEIKLNISIISPSYHLNELCIANNLLSFSIILVSAVIFMLISYIVLRIEV